MKPGEITAYHIAIAGHISPDYWMNVRVPAYATLEDLDQFLRDTWLECCDHLSAFTIGGTRYESHSQDIDDFLFGSSDEDDGDLYDFDDVDDDNVDQGNQPAAKFETELPEISNEQVERVRDLLNAASNEVAKDIGVDDGFEDSGEFSAREFTNEEVRVILAEHGFSSEMVDGLLEITPDELMVMFDFAEVVASSPLMQDFWAIEPSEDMHIELREVINEGVKFCHEYDYGTTTELDLRVISAWTDEIDNGQGGVEIIARNELPREDCVDCGKPAELICTMCMYPYPAFLCKTCSRKHDCQQDGISMEEMMLPLVNSPRVGMCGYEG
jgi:hypothetical protein